MMWLTDNLSKYLMYWWPWSSSLGQYIGDPIDCWTPAEFSGQWTKYADQYCWVKNTYYVPMTERIPEHETRGSLEIAYYQWTPIILAFQAFLFIIPGLLWKVGCRLRLLILLSALWPCAILLLSVCLIGFLFWCWLRHPPNRQTV